MLLSMFLRSFFMQAGWNYERFQNLGFAFALEPALKRIYPDRAKLKAALLRHLQIFNTQPYMAGFILGNIARMEERAAVSNEPEAETRNIMTVKQALASTFASIGDRVFWGRLKPMTTQICLLLWSACGFYGWLLAGYGEAPSIAVVLAGPLAGILGFSAVSIYWRWRGIKAGYSCGGQANCALDAADWPGQIRMLSVAGFIMSLGIAFLSFAVLFGFCRLLSVREAVLRLASVFAVLVLHRLCRAYGRSVFFAAGMVLTVCVTVYMLLGAV